MMKTVRKPDPRKYFRLVTWYMGSEISYPLKAFCGGSNLLFSPFSCSLIQNRKPVTQNVTCKSDAAEEARDQRILGDQGSGFDMKYWIRDQHIFGSVQDFSFGVGITGTQCKLFGDRGSE